MGFLTRRDVFACSAAVLLVSLGFGIIYLVVADRLSPGAAIVIVVGTFAGLMAAIRVGRLLDDSERP